ncbi:MAG: hypothetical protein A2514_05740 [Gammaproteobacteria bacterium RIFOXYD12_FULL_61_37]|nr:MAG: hypothetical protein A2514_05740 [Gammaproteobacteria bacterium RIFOXYD12_FULL_61_37]
MKTFLSLTLAAALTVAVPAYAAENMGHDMATHPAHHSPAAADAMSEGTVKRLDPAAGTVTLAHGPIENLFMPGMTMSFPVQDPSMLAGLSVGAKVRFQAEEVGEVIRITKIELAN